MYTAAQGFASKYIFSSLFVRFQSLSGKLFGECQKCFCWRFSKLKLLKSQIGGIVCFAIHFWTILYAISSFSFCSGSHNNYIQVIREDNKIPRTTWKLSNSVGVEKQLLLVSWISFQKATFSSTSYKPCRYCCQQINRFLNSRSQFM